MDNEYTKSFKYKLFIIQFFLPNPIELIPYFFISLLALVILSNQTLLVILAGNSPVTQIAMTDVFGERMQYISELLAIPILGRIILFIFWLGIGSIAYAIVWLFQNLAVEVYDDFSASKVRGQNKGLSSDGWWSSPFARVLFVLSGASLLVLFLLISTNILLPAWAKLFQLGLQDLSKFYGIFQLLVSVIGTAITLHILVLFWKIYTRVKKIFYITSQE